MSVEDYEEKYQIEMGERIAEALQRGLIKEKYLQHVWEVLKEMLLSFSEQL